MKYLNATSTTLSLFIHALIIVFLIMHIHHDRRFIIPGDKQIILASLVFTPPKPQPIVSETKPAPPIAKHSTLPKPIPKHPVIKTTPKPVEKTKPKPQKHTPHLRPHPAETKAISGDMLNKLAALIYRDIAAHKTYPDMAQQLNQTGIATVSFTLHPDGKISQLTLVHSSGYDDLDQAALAAVTNAQPLAGIKHYLAHPKPFQLDIHFQN